MSSPVRSAPAASAGLAASSSHARRMIFTPPEMASVAMIAATMRSGHADAGAEHARRGGQDDAIGDRVVARADPHRAHVRVALAEAIQHQRHRDIGDQRRNADRAHDVRLRRRRRRRRRARRRRCTYRPSATSVMPLDQRGARAPRQRQARDAQAKWRSSRRRRRNRAHRPAARASRRSRRPTIRPRTCRH